MSFLTGITKNIKLKKKAVIKKGENLHRDWLYSLCFLFVLIFVGAVFGVYMFIGAENIEPSGTAVPPAPPTNSIDQALLSETINHYSAKEARFEEFLNDFKGAPQI